jgi:hypothetical protein
MQEYKNSKDDDPFKNDSDLNLPDLSFNPQVETPYLNPKKKKFKKAKKNNNKFLIFLNILVIFICGALIFHILRNQNEPKPNQVILENKNLTEIQIPQKLDFAEENVPLEKMYVKEAFERDFYILAGQEYQTILYLKRSNKYFPYIEKELKKRKLPSDLKYVAVAESALIDNATSYKGAVGIWQFIPETGEAYGLEINDYVDERRDYQKATDAALDYLEDLHAEFKSWTLAAAAYNVGEGVIRSGLKNQEVDDYYSLYLNQETARYLFRIISIKEIMENQENYGFNLDITDYYSFEDFREVDLEIEYDEDNEDAPDFDLNEWALDQNSNLREIKELNPWIIGRTLPEGDWEIRVPR